MNFIDVSLHEIKRMMENGTSIVFWGAGRAFDTFITTTSYMDWNKYVIYLVDNNANLWGNIKKIGDLSLKIDSWPQVLGKEKGSVLVIITTYYALVEIYNELVNLDVRDNIKGCFYGFVKDKTMEEGIMKGDFFYEIPCDNYEIPKIIHYCWFGRNKIPDYCKEWMRSWRKKCPGWEIVEWNEDNYDVRQCEYMSEVYDEKVWGFMADYPRLDIIYKYGGIYLDVDVEILKSLEPLRYQKAFAAYQHIDSVNFGSGFGSIPGNEIFKKMRDYYHTIHFDNSNRKSCVYHQRPFLLSEGLVENGRFQKLPSINIYPAIFTYNKYLFRMSEFPVNDQYTIHYGMNSHVPIEKRKDYARYDLIYDKIKMEAYDV